MPFHSALLTVICISQNPLRLQAGAESSGSSQELLIRVEEEKGLWSVTLGRRRCQ